MFLPLFYLEASFFSWRIIFQYDCFFFCEWAMLNILYVLLDVLMITSQRYTMSSCMQMHASTQEFFYIGRYAEAWAQMEEWKCWRMLLSDVFFSLPLSHLNLKQIYATRQCMSFRWSFWVGRCLYKNVLCTLDVYHSPLCIRSVFIKTTKGNFHKFPIWI